MKLIKIGSSLQIKLSKIEWEYIGLTSGWIKEAQDIDVTRQVADTNGLYDAMTKIRNYIGSLQNSPDQNTIENVKLSIASILNDIKNNNWVAKMDAEIGLNVESLETALESNNFTGFSQILEKKFKTDLDESKAQLDRQQAKQQGAQQGVDLGIEEGGEL